MRWSELFYETNTTFAPFNKLCTSNTELCADLRKKLNPAINTSDNRLASGQGYSFDDAGNTTRDASERKFTYDASGKLIAEYSTIVETTNAKVGYVTNDHLGSPRINTDANGAVTSRHDYHPFGEEIATSQRTTGQGYIEDTVRKQFTGYERDDETELDFAQARMYACSAGRFTTPDPILMGLSRATDPQQMNRYAYVRNQPYKFSDPDGRDLVLKGGTKKADQDRIINNLVRIYQTDAGRAAIKKLDTSAITHTIGAGQLERKLAPVEGVVRAKYGETRSDAKFYEDPKNPGKAESLATPRENINVTITLDFSNRDNEEGEARYSGTAAPRTEYEVVAEEIGHALDIDNDPVKERNKNNKQSHEFTDEFVKSAKGKKTMKEEEARKEVLELLAPRKKEEKKVQ